MHNQHSALDSVNGIELVPTADASYVGLGLDHCVEGGYLLP
jgi:hypothetical protein